ncbi:hypothetical protein [Acetobacter aceti]|uniref:Uncharacterized protein n=1 Tax=Acetobacter aceti TaxID=435 RepID=A0A6S6PEV2_ACEAC|nr:hypothetical protein [Acetobacter aceti]BCI65889.1 hypothetical protein AAJCM20276_05130 [Acetobacter aceti]
MSSILRVLRVHHTKGATGQPIAVVEAHIRSSGTPAAGIDLRVSLDNDPQALMNDEQIALFVEKTLKDVMLEQKNVAVPDQEDAV